MAKKRVEEKSGQNGDSTKKDDDLSSNEDDVNFSDPEGYVDDVTDEGKSQLS